MAQRSVGPVLALALASACGMLLGMLLGLAPAPAAQERGAPPPDREGGAAGRSGQGQSAPGGAGQGQAGSGQRSGEGGSHGGPPSAPSEPPIDWRAAEKGVLADHVQLTFPDRFVKAGESYFSPDGARVVFQAVEVPADGAAPEDFYAMFVADVVREGQRIAALRNIRRVSPPGSANTCGWFHPTDPNVLIFASTMGPPTESQPPGYQRGTGRYRWMFPPEMRIVQVDLGSADGSTESIRPLVPHAGAYMAECSISPDGRHLIYCSLESNQGDIFVKDLVGDRVVRVVGEPGYDGGPFFSPDGRRICWRSDRLGDNLLQLYSADLRFGPDGAIVGIGPEVQLTRNEHVNWCPFWHPSGLFQVYATSQEGHRNYEVFRVDSDPGLAPGADPTGKRGPVRYGTGVRRVTSATGADVLPAFDADGTWMIWTSQRGDDGSSQLWAARWLGDR